MLLVCRWVYLRGNPFGLLFVLSLNVVVLIVSLVKRQIECLCSIFAFNLAAVFLPRLFSDGFKPGLLFLDFIIVTFNILGVVVAHLYKKKFELYADVPDSHSNLPSFGPEVNIAST